MAHKEQSLFKRAATLVAGTGLASVASFVMMAALARLTSMEDFGRVAYALNVSALLGLFLTFGIPSFVVVVRHREDAGILAEVNRLAVLSVLASLPLVVLAGGATWAIKRIAPDVLVAVALGGIAAVVVPHVAGICQAEGRWGDISRYQIALNAIRAILVVAVVAVFRHAPYAVAIWASAVGLIIGSLLVAYRERARLRWAAGLPKLRPHLADFRNLALTNAIIVLASRADVLLAGLLLSAHDLGAYSAAGTLILGLTLVSMAVRSVSLHDAAAMQPGSNLVARRQRQLLPWVLVSILLTVVLSPYVIPLIFGARYSAAVTPFNFLCVAMLLGILVTPLESHFSAYASHAGLFLKIVQFVALLVFALLMGRTLAGLGAAVLLSRAVGWAWAFVYHWRSNATRVPVDQGPEAVLEDSSAGGSLP